MEYCPRCQNEWNNTFLLQQKQCSNCGYPHSFTCSICEDEISQEEFEMYNGWCSQCHILEINSDENFEYNEE